MTTYAPEFVPIATLAEDLTMDRSNLRRYVIRHGLHWQEVRTDGSRGQRTLALTTTDAELVRKLREAEGFTPSPTAIQPTGGTMLLNDGTNPRRQIRKWIEEDIRDQNDIHLPSVAERIVRRVHDNADILRAMLFPAIYEEVRHYVGKTRGLHLSGESALTDAGLAAQAERLKSRWARWLEHANGRHIRLMTMTRDDLLAAAKERRQRAETESRIAALWEAMAAKMSDGVVVEDVFTPEQIDALNVQINDGKPIPEDQG